MKTRITLMIVASVISACGGKNDSNSTPAAVAVTEAVPASPDSQTTTLVDPLAKSPSTLASTYANWPTFFLRASDMTGRNVTTFTVGGVSYNSVFNATAVATDSAGSHFDYSSQEIDATSQLTVDEQKYFTFASVYNLASALSPTFYRASVLGTTGGVDIHWEYVSASTVHLVVLNSNGDEWTYSTTAVPTGVTSLIVTISSSGAVDYINGASVTFVHSTTSVTAGTSEGIQFGDGSFQGKLYESVMMPNISNDDDLSLACYHSLTYKITVPLDCHW